MKKIIIFLLVLVITSFSVHIEILAMASEESIDITQYTVEDLKTMSASEFRELLAAFERDYDPYNTYNSNPIINNNLEMTNIINNNLVEPLWTSGTKDGDDTGSHEIITARACAILTSDIGFFGETSSEKILIALSISLASLLPDREISSIATLFAGHFYNPYTEQNFLDETDNTAKTNAHYHFMQAVNASNVEQTEENRAEMYEQLGRCLHFLQDACQPMHATNFTATSSPVGAHYAFEKFVEERIDGYIDGIDSIYSYDFHGDGNFVYAIRTPAYFVQQAAFIAYEYGNSTNRDDSQYGNIWNSVANITVQNSVAFSALMMYSFAQFADIELT